MFYNTDKILDKKEQHNILIDIKSQDSNINSQDVSMEKIRKLEDNIKHLKKNNIKIGIAGIVGMVGISAFYIITS
jgi:hypothetical protein